MKKRKWTNIKAVETDIIKMREEGQTRQEIANALGLEKAQIKNWISRHNRKQARLASGLPPRRRGRPRRSKYTTIEEYQYEIQPLQTVNLVLNTIRRGQRALLPGFVSCGKSIRFSPRLSRSFYGIRHGRQPCLLLSQS